MSTPTWAEARTVKTPAIVRASLFARLADNGSTINGWPGSAPQRAIVEGNAAAMAYETEVRAAIAALASPETAILAGDDWVDAVMRWFDLSNGYGGKGRIPATKAVWDVPLLVASAAAPLTIDNTSKIQLMANGGQIYECSQGAAVTMDAANSYKRTVRFTARLVGTAAGNVAPGQIVKVISGPAGLSVDDSGTQVLVTAARDQETSTAFIARGLGRWATLGAGWTRASFDYLIPLYAPTLTRWKVNTANPFGPGTIGVVLANAAGAATGPEVAAVTAGLGAPETMTLGTGGLFVSSASATTAVVSGTISGDGSNPNLLANAKAALDRISSVYPIGGVGGKLDFALLLGLLSGGVYPAWGVPGFGGFTASAITSPAGVDVSGIGADEVLLFTYGGLTLL
jgi:hypothetical protein